jgi:hypothetical protein
MLRELDVGRWREKEMKFGVVVAAIVFAFIAHAQDHPRVFVTNSNSWEVRGGGGGVGGSWGAASAGGARPQTAEVIKTFGQRCPQVIVNNRVDASDYVVELDHEGGKGLLRHKDKIAVFVKTSGDSIFSESTLSLGGSVQDACGAITKHWADHAKDLKTASAPFAPATPQSGPGSPGQSENSASLNISSNPSGADIEIDGNFVGSTPSTVQLRSGEHEISISKKGFEAWHRKLNVTGGNINISADLDASGPNNPTAP